MVVAHDAGRGAVRWAGHAARDGDVRPLKRPPIRALALAALAGIAGVAATVRGEPGAGDPLFRAVDLNVGESAEVVLSDGKRARVKLADLREQRCGLRGAVRRAEACVEVDGVRGVLVCGTYHLPMAVGGVLADCPVTRGYTFGSSKDNVWALDKDARIRLWAAGSPWILPGTFQCPLDQTWFATDTQMGNDPCYVNACDLPGATNIYYHYGLDFGGAEGLERVSAATDGIVISKGDTLFGEGHPPQVKPRADVVYVRDDRGWYYRYSHLQSIEPALEAGRRIGIGASIGVLGKEGGSGGWSHLHFDVSMPQPSGRYGIADAYAFAFEAYRRRQNPPMIAVARPHSVAWAGEEVTLDASNSWHSGGAGRIRRFEWRLSNGGVSEGPVVRQTYGRPGHYSEVLKITDDTGRFDYDFAVVQVFDREKPKPPPPAIHAAFWPTRGLRTGAEVTFKARTFGVRPDEGREAWDFGDGSPPAFTRSDGNARQHAPDGYAVITHRYERPGDYLVAVSRADDRGFAATGRLHVRIGSD